MAILTRPATSFIGRAQELRVIHDAFRGGARLVSLWGPPGIGKSRLALRFADQRSPSRPWGDSVCFCDLGRSAGLVGAREALARALGAEADPGRIGPVLAGRGPLLLLLDDFDQVTAQAAETLGPWLQAAPEARLLVTSRERLRFGSEHAIEIGPLGLPEAGREADESDAYRLLLERARTARGGRPIATADAPQLQTIVHRLDGIPLAIEMAAARMGVLGADQLLQRLEDRFSILGTAGTDRHATLRQAIDWSWNLLQPWEQRAMAQCSVFRGGFSAEAAEHVVDLGTSTGAPPVLNVLQTLRDRSLLRSVEADDRPSDVRFDVFDSIREYAAAALDRLGIGEETRDRHAQHVVRSCSALATSLHDKRGVSLRRLDLERENLIVAHRRAIEQADGATLALEACIALGELLLLRGPLSVLLAILDRTLDPLPSAVDPALAAKARCLRGRARLLAGSTAEGFDDLRQAIAVAVEIGDPCLQAMALGLMASGYFAQGALEAAGERYELAVLTARGRDPRLEGILRTELGWVRLDQGRLPEAQQGLEEARRLLRRAGDWRSAAKNGSALGTLALRLGRLSDARAHYQEALSLVGSSGDRQLEGQLLCNSGYVQHEAGQLDQARVLFEEALQIAADLGDLRSEGVTCMCLASLEHEQGGLEDAETLLRRAVRVLHDSGDRWHEVEALGCLAAVLATGGDARSSAATFGTARKLQEELGAPELRVLLEVQEGHLDLARASDAVSRGDAQGADDLRRAAGRRLEFAPDDQPCFEDVRLAQRILSRMWRAAGTPARVMTVGEGARWLVLPDGKEVRLQKGPALRRMLLALVRRRQRAPGCPVPQRDLFEAGWPGQPAPRETLASRVQVGIHRLKQSGLHDLIVSCSDGYFLEPQLLVRLAGSSQDKPAPRRP